MRQAEQRGAAVALAPQDDDRVAAPVDDVLGATDRPGVRVVRVDAVSGVGPETDRTLCDIVADVRAPTPSAAAELVVPDARVGQASADRLLRRISSRMRETLDGRRRRLVAAHRRIERRAPPAQIAALRQRLDEDRRVLDRAMARLVPARRQRLVHARRQLDALSPLNVLGRGYAIVEGSDGRIRAGVGELSAGDKARVRMRDGRASVTVEGVDKSA